MVGIDHPLFYQFNKIITMKKILKPFLIIFSLFLGTAVFAQNKEAQNDFSGYWYMQLQGGIGHTIGENTFGNLISPAASFNFGYRFTPVWGLRVGIGGWQAKGSLVEIADPYKFNFLQGNLDVKVDICSIFSGYRKSRALSPYLFAGLGINGAFNNEEANALRPYFSDNNLLWDGSMISPAGRVGIGTDFRITDAVQINLEVNGNILNDKFNSKRGSVVDWQLEAKAGLTFNFGLGKKSRRAAADAAPAQTFVPDSQKQAEDSAPAKKAEPVVQTPAVAETPVKEEAPKAEFKEVKEDIFFTIGKYELNAEEVSKLDEIAGILGQNPDTKVQITGYADVNTGTAKRNMYLSKKRAEAVSAYLEGKGIASERISIDYKGSAEQPYDTPQKNRVAVCLIK